MSREPVPRVGEIIGASDRRGARAQRSLSEPADGTDSAHARFRQGLDAWRGRPPDRRRRRALPGPLRRLRRVRDRAQPPRGDRRDRGGDGCAHGQPAAARRHAAVGRARRAAAGPRAGERRRDGARQHGHRGGRGGDQDRPRRDRAAAGALRRARLPRAHARHRCRSTATRSSATASGRCCRAATPSASATCRRSSASSRAATSPPSSSSRCRARASTCPAPDYLPGAQRLCREAGALFVCDEVQTGIGRTGRFLALEHWDLQPDMICLAKALSGGLVPIGALLVSRAAFDSVFDGMERAVRHGSTFGGNDLAAAAALATLRVLDEEDLVARAERAGRAAAGADAPAGGALRGRPRRARAGADVGDRIRAARRGPPRAGCGSASSAASRACSRSWSPCRCSTSTASSARSPGIT